MAELHTYDGARVAFRISPELLERAETALQQVRENPTRPPHVDALVTVILELTDSGLDYYFLEPLRRIEAGAMSMASARLGIAAAGRGLPTIIRRVVASLDEQQILALADFLDELLVRGTQKTG